jgi:hypothetical protein
MYTGIPFAVVALTTRTVNTLKGQCHEIFDPRFFSSNNPLYGPDSRAKAVLFCTWLQTCRDIRDNRLQSLDSEVSMTLRDST